MSDSAKDILARARGEKQEQGPVIESLIFGYGHRARSGKDTAAAYVRSMRGGRCVCNGVGHEHHGYDIRIYSFAGELKREVNENAMRSGGMIKLFDNGLRDEVGGFVQENGNILRLPEWVQYEENPDMSDPLCPYGKQRTLLQWWGTEYRRSINEHYWTNKLAKRIAEDKPEIALVTDVRFPNEVRFVQKYGEVIKVDRPGLPSLQGAAGVHASEKALADFDGWDDVIKNDSDLETFKERVLFSFDMLMSTHPVTR